MTDKSTTVTIEILGKFYPVRCPEGEAATLMDAAKFLNEKMSEVRDSGKVINLERIAIITALNISNLYLQQDKQKGSIVNKINQHISQLQDKLDNALNKAMQTELIYTAE